ncbi:MAG: hypothetical protein ACFB0A_04265 [Croceivirga sp.]
MTLYRPSQYFDFIAYCKKRKIFSKDYQNAKESLFNGDLHLEDYFIKLRKIKNAAIELELQYFDILHMRG